MPPPAISLPQTSPPSCRREGFAAGGMRAESPSAAPRRQLPCPRPRAGQRCDVSLGHGDILLSPGAVGWLFLEVWGHPTTVSARGRDALRDGKAETPSVEPEGCWVPPPSPRTGKHPRTSPERCFVAEAPEKPERFTVETLTGVLVGAHKTAPLSFSILAATARAAPCKSETTFSWGDGICCHWRKKIPLPALSPEGDPLPSPGRGTGGLGGGCPAPRGCGIFRARGAADPG